MTVSNFPACLKFTLEQEGGWSDDPNDPGGCTSQGVTLATYQAEVGPQATCADLRNMTDEQRDHIYLARYWNPIRGDDLPPGVDLLVMDHGVNAGPARSVMTMQEVLGVTADGIVGPHTLAELAIRGPAVIAELAEAQRAYYRSLAEFPRYGNGWLARVDRREGVAMELAVNKTN